MDSRLIEKIVQNLEEIDPSLGGEFSEDIRTSLQNPDKLKEFLESKEQELKQEFEEVLNESGDLGDHV